MDRGMPQRVGVESHCLGTGRRAIGRLRASAHGVDQHGIPESLPIRVRVEMLHQKLLDTVVLEQGYLNVVSAQQAVDVVIAAARPDSIPKPHNTNKEESGKKASYRHLAQESPGFVP